MISRYVIDAVAYGKEKTKWSGSNIRAYLNGSFYDNSFETDEKRFILTTTLNGIDNDDKTYDHVFLLSPETVDECFSVTNEYRLGVPTKYVSSLEGFSSLKSNVAWRTRDPQIKVGEKGKMEKTSANVLLGIRPAIYIRVMAGTPIK